MLSTTILLIRLGVFFRIKDKEIINGVDTNSLLVDFPKPGSQIRCIDFYISWQDIDALLKLPKKESRLNHNALNIIRQYLNADDFEEYARENNISFNNIFINLVPLVLNAGISLYPSIQDKIVVESTEATSFSDYFKSDGPFLTNAYEYQILDY